MKLAITTMILAIAATSASFAASLTNKDADAHIVVVTEGASKSELSIGAGETVSFCSQGCFMTAPDGDRLPLSGSETVEISGGKAILR